MYFPYFRGKQFELITIREMAQQLAASNFVPVIEPVKESLGGLERTLDAVKKYGGRAIVIVNPYHGDHREDGAGISQLLEEKYSISESITPGILLRSDLSIDEVIECHEQHSHYNPAIIHAGFNSAKAFSEYLEPYMTSSSNIFVEEHAKLLYRKHFNSPERILVRDGFKRQRNADYPPLEEFSDLHVTYQELGMSGFGDFLTVGDSYSESGGPAYAVAIHLTFIDPENDDVMYVYHFVSDTRDTPTDPAGKFLQALSKLIEKINSHNSKILETSAIEEFRDLYSRKHFPGLGYIKKLSMKHHIETLVDYFG